METPPRTNDVQKSKVQTSIKTLTRTSTVQKVNVRTSITTYVKTSPKATADIVGDLRDNIKSHQLYLNLAKLGRRL
jgi:hypothetical protein